MANEIKWTRRASKQLEKIDVRYIARIDQKVKELASFPDVELDIKDLRGKQYENQYRLRVGNYRVIFEVIAGVPTVIEVQEVLKRSERTYN
ncbi:hypothetical protein A4G20_01775 [Pasteurellaceae bacterium RH1A]|nr:hypothetical protein A4G20_01775 [Pasteurellaceae bacterium RH1A]